MFYANRDVGAGGRVCALAICAAIAARLAVAGAAGARLDAVAVSHLSAGVVSVRLRLGLFPGAAGAGRSAGAGAGRPDPVGGGPGGRSAAAGRTGGALRTGRRDFPSGPAAGAFAVVLVRRPGSAQRRALAPGGAAQAWTRLAQSRRVRL